MELDKSVKEIMEKAKRLAKEKGHEYYSPEHFLLALLKNEATSNIFDDANFNKEKFENLVEKYFTENILPLNRVNPVPSAVLRDVIDYAFKLDKFEGRNVNIFDIIISIFNNQDSPSPAMLTLCGVDTDFVKTLEEKNKELDEEEEDKALDEEDDDDGLKLFNVLSGKSGKSKEQKEKRISKDFKRYTIDITELASKNELMPVIGREKEVAATIQTLCRKTKNNPIYVGDPGTGKTAIVEGLAQLIVGNKVPDVIKGYKVYSIEMGSIVAGTQYRGQLEERIKNVIDGAIDQEKCILFIDEIHTIIGSGNDSALDVANILKPALARGKLKVIGATTYDEFKKVLSKDKALIRRFQKIEVEEPSRDDSVTIIKGIAPKYAEYHGVEYEEQALEKAVDLSIRYMNMKKLPDKAIDVIDEAGSYCKINQIKTVDDSIIEKVVSNLTKVPVEALSESDSDKLKTLDSDIKDKIFGQDEAITEIVKSIKKAKAGFKNPEKPDACYLFTGSTGVGKTELCKVLSKQLNQKLIRFDMSEYQEEYTVSKLIGSAAGYVGYEEGGLLTEAVKKDPYSIVLFDEIEKAHRKVYNLLLQIMDYGTLTDNQGYKIDFRNCIIVMTSNVGAEKAFDYKGIGFGKLDEGNANDIIKSEINKYFTPEFRNRLTGIITFNQLNDKAIRAIAVAEVEKIKERAKEGNVVINVSENVYDKIIKDGYSKEYGGRNIAKVAEDLLSDKLVDLVLFGELKSGGIVNIDVLDDELLFNVAKKKEKNKVKIV